MKRKTAASSLLIMSLLLSLSLIALFTQTVITDIPTDTLPVDETSSPNQESDLILATQDSSQSTTPLTIAPTTAPPESISPQTTQVVEVPVIETPANNPQTQTNPQNPETTNEEPPIKSTPTVELITTNSQPEPILAEPIVDCPLADIPDDLFSSYCDGTLPCLPIGPLILRLSDGTESYFISTLVGLPPGYNTFPGWCVDKRYDAPREEDIYVTLYSSLCPPTELASQRWDMVNYILNHKQGNMMDIQNAIWYFVKMDGVGWWNGAIPGAEPLINDALLNGDGYTPGPGDVLAIICIPDECTQITIIEIVLPGCEGLTPGFWKNHLDLWVKYSPDDKFSDVFGVTITINAGKQNEITDPTLLEALEAKGGINEEKGVYDALARHAVAALLNAAHPLVDYPLSEQVIKDVVKEIIENSNYTDAQPFKNALDKMNNLGGGIDAHGNPI